MSPRLEPPPVGFFRLLTDAERDAEFPIRHALDPAERFFNEIDKFRIGPLARLQHDRTIVVLVRPLRDPEDFIERRLKAVNRTVALPDSAVEAVLHADIRKLDETAVVGDAADFLRFDPMSRLAEELPLGISLFKPHRVREVFPRPLVPRNDVRKPCHAASLRAAAASRHASSASGNGESVRSSTPWRCEIAMP